MGLMQKDVLGVDDKNSVKKFQLVPEFLKVYKINLLVTVFAVILGMIADFYFYFFLCNVYL